MAEPLLAPALTCADAVKIELAGKSGYESALAARG
jgi:hypothetical protein